MNSFFLLLKILLEYKERMALAIVFGIATIASGIGLIGTSSYLISRAALHPSIAVLQVAIVGVRFFGITRGIFRYLERLISHSVNLKILARLRRTFFDALEPVLPARRDHLQSGDLLSRVTADVEILEFFFIRVFSPIIIAVFVTVGMAFFVGTFHPSLIFPLVMGLFLSGVGVPMLSLKIRKRLQSNLLSARGNLSAVWAESILGLRDLIAFQLQDKKKQALQALENTYEDAQYDMISRESLVEALNVLIPGLTLWFVLLAAIPLVRQGALEGIFLAVVTLITLASFEAVLPLGMASQNMEMSLAAAERLFALQKIPPEIETPKCPLQVSYPVDLKMNHLGFRYQGGDDWALHDVSFHLTPEQRIAIVGPSGAGKTTIFNLLLRLWDFDSGSILINQEDVRRYNPLHIRSLFCPVSQRDYLFSRTLKENLLVGNADADDDQLILMIEKVGLGTWFGTLKNGLNTWLGEQGDRVSGGEKQRILIARSMLRSAPIWLLDEPTVHLDANTENEIMKLLFQITNGKSSLWIQHRLIGMDKMDNILVIREGKICEQGKHDSLLQQRGYYAFMWEEQHNLFR